MLMNATQLAAELEPYFGYSLTTRAGLLTYFDDALELRDREATDLELVAQQLDRVVHWDAERWPGESPLVVAGRLRASRSKAPPRPLPAQTADVLARHFAGLYMFVSGKPYGDRRRENPRGGFMIDLNPRADRRAEPVYFQSLEDESIHPWYVLENAGQFSESEGMFFDVRDSFDEDPARNRAAAAQLVRDFPRLCRFKATWFKQVGVSTDALPPDYEDLDGRRLIAAYAALRPIAEVLLQRAAGTGDLCLADADCRKAAEVAQGDPEFPPHLMLGMLAPALSRDLSGARKTARMVLDRQLGVPLTRRWATMIVDGGMFQ